MSGPPAAVAATRLALRRWMNSAYGEGRLTPHDPITIACSGGADSLALTAAALFEARQDRRTVRAVTVDHGLQAGSAARAEQVAALLGDLGCHQVQIRRVSVGVAGGPEGAARTARYGALREFTGDGGWVLLAHTLDDQAESVLLGLGRGSGGRSLAGMAAYNPPWGRPFLGVRRTETVAACSALQLPVWDDPHNLDPRFTRVRLRHEVLPLLEEVLGGGVAAALARTADQLRADADALAELAGQALSDLSLPGPSIAVAGLAQLPPAIRTRVLKKWVESAGVRSATAKHIDALDRLVTDWRGQGPAFLPHGFSVVRRHAILDLSRPESRIDPDAPATDRTDDDPT